LYLSRSPSGLLLDLEINRDTLRSHDNADRRPLLLMALQYYCSSMQVRLLPSEKEQIRVVEGSLW